VERSRASKCNQLLVLELINPVKKVYFVALIKVFNFYLVLRSTRTNKNSLIIHSILNSSIWIIVDWQHFVSYNWAFCNLKPLKKMKASTQSVKPLTSTVN